MTYDRATRIWGIYIPMIQFVTIIHTCRMILTILQTSSIRIKEMHLPEFWGRRWRGCARAADDWHGDW
jgi:hypothetical protein